MLVRSGPVASLGPLKFTFCSNPEGAQTLRSKLDLKPVPNSTKQNTSLSLLSSMEVMAPLPLRGKSAGLMERAREAGLAYYEHLGHRSFLLTFRPGGLSSPQNGGFCGSVAF